MKKMNLKKLLCLTAAVLLLAGALVVPTGASSAYQTYTYSIGGTALYSPRCLYRHQGGRRVGDGT